MKFLNLFGLLFLLIVIVLSVSFVSAFSLNQLGVNACYQETANVSNSCGGLNTGSYAKDIGTFFDIYPNCYDGNWSSICKTTISMGSELSFYINYSKENNLNSAIWEIKDASGLSAGTITNLTISATCVLLNPMQLRIRVNNGQPTNPQATYDECYNGASWETLRNFNTTGLQWYSLFEEAIILNTTRSSENLTFIINQNFTRYLSIPNSISTLTHAYLNFSGYATNSTSLCYQESANVSTACGGLNTGNYLIKEGIEVHTITGSAFESCGLSGATNVNISYIYINYTKPTSSLSSSLWTVKKGTGGSVNYAIPSSCWNANVSRISFRIGLASWVGFNTAQSVGDCLNSLGVWERVTTCSYGNGGGYDPGYSSRLIDGDFDTASSWVANLGGWIEGNSGSWLTSNFYEEAMSWYVINGTSYPTNVSLSIVNSTAWSYLGQFNQTNNRTNNLASYINQYFIPSYLVGTNYLIPFIFNSNVSGILYYSGLSFDNEGILENSQTYSSSTYETKQESFIFNLTYDNSYYTSILANLIYNGTSYAGTRTGSGSSAIFTKTMDMPSVDSQQNKSFYWQVALTNSTTTSYYNSTTNNQTINQISLTICGSAPQNVPFINFTFKDETTGTLINVTADLATWSYYLGGSSVTKSLIFSNTTINPSYAFCFTPADKTLYETLTFQYSATGYPQRQYYLATSLTNTTTNKVLYLLGSSDGIPSSFQITNTAGSPISGVTVQVERQFSGIWTLIAQSTSDSSGLATFWVNPNYDHRITVSKTGYAGQTLTIRPTQALYTIQMSGSSSNASFTQELEGIMWRISPGSEFLSPNTTYTFDFNVTALLGNLVNCKFEILNSSGSVLDSATGCSGYGGNISINFNTASYPKIVRKFYLDTGSGYWVIDPIDNWISASNISSTNTIKSFFQTLAQLDDELGGDDARSTFTKMVLFFFVVTLFLGLITFFTGVELSNPGMCVFIFYGLIVLASAGGWFQVTIFSTHTNSYSEWFNKMYIPGLMTLFVISFYLNNWRRNQT